MCDAPCAQEPETAEASLVCWSCGAQWSPHATNASKDFRAQDLRARLREGPVDFQCDPPAGWFIDDYTLRIAATSAGLVFESAQSERLLAHTTGQPQGYLRPQRRLPLKDITLVVLTRSDDERTETLLRRLSPAFPASIVVIDPKAHWANGLIDTVSALNVAVLERRLEGDFGAQRNAAQAALTTGWALHVDSDEGLDDALLGSLPDLIAMSDRDHLDAIGFRRKNFVDGIVSDLFPDVQYRLVRRSVRFTGRVHERPDVCSEWPRTSFSLTGAIDHHLSRDRVVERNRQYDLLGQSTDRNADEDRLLRPYSP